MTPPTSNPSAMSQELSGAVSNAGWRGRVPGYRIGWEYTDAEWRADVWRGAASLDHPSLYMGGPSQQNRRKAAQAYRDMVKEPAK